MALLVWRRFKLGLGFPFSGGWAEQPFWVSDIIALFEETNNQEESYKRKMESEKSKSNMNNNKPSKNNPVTLTGAN